VKINKQNKNSKEISVTYADDDSINISIFDNQILMEVVGAFDNNLKELERFTGSKIYFRGNSITIKGKKFENERVKGAIEYLIDRFRSDKKIDRNDVISSLNKDMINDIKNQSIVQSLEEIIKTPKRSVIPRSKKQKEYVKAKEFYMQVLSLKNLHKELYDQARSQLILVTND